MSMLLDVDYVLLGSPGILISVWAWSKGMKARTRASRISSTWDLSGAEAALRVLKSGGLEQVPIDVSDGPLADYYDAARHRLRLSEGVYFGRSLASIGMATHEAGHALQAAARSPWSLVSRTLVPLADLSSFLAWLLLLAGGSLGFFRLTIWGFVVFSVAVVVQLINLGAEHDASRRTRSAVPVTVTDEVEERAILAQVQDAAAWSHVAAVLTGFPSHVARELSGLWRAVSAKS